MSQINGDKSRFNRERKQNIHRRLRTRELLEAAGKRLAAGKTDGEGESKVTNTSRKKIKAVPAE